MATIKDQVYMYCKDNDRLFKNLSKRQVAKKVVDDLGVPYNTAHRYVQEYYKHFTIEGDNKGLEEGVMNSMQEAFMKSGYSVPIEEESTEEEIIENVTDNIETSSTNEEVNETPIRVPEGSRSTINVGFISGNNFMGRFEITPNRVIQYIPQGKDAQGNRKDSAKIFFDSEYDLDTFYIDMKRLFEFQSLINGEDE